MLLDIILLKLYKYKIGVTIMRFLNGDNLATAAKKLEDSFLEYTRLLKAHDIKKTEGNTTGARIQAALLNHEAFKLSYCKDKPELLKQFNIIKSIITQLGDYTEAEQSSTDDRALAKVRELVTENNIDTCKKQIANVSFYNSLMVLTHALFDEHGVAKHFIIEFLSNFTELVKTQEEIAFRQPGTQQNQLVYQSIINSLFMKFIDPLFAELAQLQLKDQKEDAKKPSPRTSPKKAEEARKSSSSIEIAKYIEDLRKRLITEEGPHKVGVAGQIQFITDYQRLHDALQNFVKSKNLTQKLTAEKLASINSTAFHNPFLSIWDRVRNILEDEDVKDVATQHADLKLLSAAVSLSYHETVKFDRTTILTLAQTPQKMGFFRSLGGAKSRASTAPSLSSSGRTTPSSLLTPPKQPSPRSGSVVNMAASLVGRSSAPVLTSGATSPVPRGSRESTL